MGCISWKIKNIVATHPKITSALLTLMILSAQFGTVAAGNGHLGP